MNPQVKHFDRKHGELRRITFQNTVSASNFGRC